MPEIANLKFGLVTLLVQACLIIAFGILARYSEEADARIYGNATGNLKPPYEQKNKVANYYPMFQDVHGMMFIGFGFLMTFLKRYGFSSVGLNMMIAALVIQWSLLFSGILHLSNWKFYIGITNMLSADFASAAVLITFGALLGKISPLQAIILALIEIPIFTINEYIGVNKIRAVDMGGSMFVHIFGAYFGIACARVMYNKGAENNSKEGSNYHSDLFSMIGTIFLWLYWPSFNAALAPGDDQHRAVINTYLSLAACALVTFAISALVNENKLDMVHIQNATLAGGVAIGTSVDMMLQPFMAMIIGSVAAVLSVCGYKFLTPLLASKGFHDTCGVNNLHGMPGILAAIFGAIFAAAANFENYGYSLYQMFPARAPPSVNGSDFTFMVKDGVQTVSDGVGRTALMQGGCQMAAAGLTLISAIVGGAITGFILRIPVFDNLNDENTFSDKRFWETPEEGFIMEDEWDAVKTEDNEDDQMQLTDVRTDNDDNNHDA